MGIWVRSQDKENFVECHSFNVSYANAKSGVYEIISNYRMDYDNEVYDSLGMYSSKEKALKVLDKIVEQMEFCTETRTPIKPYSRESYWDTRERVATVVFKMPQDDEVIVDG